MKKAENRLSSECGKMFQKEVPVFMEIAEFSYNTVQDKPRVALVPKNSYFERTPAYDEQTDIGPWHIPDHA